MQSNQNYGIALHVLTCLAFDEDTYMTSNEIAKSVNTNPVIVRKVIKLLSDANLVLTKKGKNGSKLAKSASEISFFEVYQIFNHGSILEPKHKPNVGCPIGFKINGLINNVMMEATLKFEATLKEHTISDIKRKI